MVTLPKGTHVQVTNILRQLNPEYWGPDALEWNPDRAFEGNENWRQGPSRASLRDPPAPHDDTSWR